MNDHMEDKLTGYFDYASATPLDEAVYEVMRPFYTKEFYNPSARYSASDNSRQAILVARKKVASVMGVKHQEIIFTSGCSEANNLAINGVLEANPGGRVLISGIEHESVRQPAYKHNYEEIPVSENGTIDLNALISMITDDVVLISVMYVNNEIGTVQPLRKISDIVAKARKSRGSGGRPLYLHSDAAQAPNLMNISRAATGVDLMSLNGGKIYGPKGSGCLFVSKNVKISPIILGGGQESGLRSGTENTSGIVGFAEALSISSTMRVDESTRLLDLRNIIVRTAKTLDCIIVAENGTSSGSIVSVMLPNRDSETVVYQLDKLDIFVSSGSACHAKSGEKSYVLSALGYSDPQSMSAIRISMGRHTTRGSIDKLLESIQQILA